MTFLKLNHMPTSRLIFHPVNAQQPLDQAHIVNCLIELGFINARAFRNNQYLAGEQFLSQITFLGCSPNISLIPGEADEHCSISLLENSEQARCLGYTHSAKPKCPHCTRRLANWPIENFQLNDQQCTCDKCGEHCNYSELIWKHECAYARSGFQVTHIYPHEAVPGDQFLEQLSRLSGLDWNYCYANSNP